MRKFLMITVVGILLLPGGLTAQKIYRDNQGRCILDLTEKAGMPAGATTNTSKTMIYKNLNPLEGSMLTVLGDVNNADNPINAEVYQKLEIAPFDMNNINDNIDGEIIDGDQNPKTKMNWEPAFRKCRDATYDGGGWRLPTQRELILIQIFVSANKPNNATLLNDLGIGIFHQSHYWSITESSTSNAWTVSVSSNGESRIVTYRKDYTSNPMLILAAARCVREVTD